jgi:acyl-CoA synthetase (AMP-forming)/AMP-acid ligase II
MGAQWEKGTDANAQDVYSSLPVRLGMTTYPLNTSNSPTNEATTTLSYDASKAWDATIGTADASDTQYQTAIAGYKYLKSNYTDSAAAGTALATGQKTYNNAINYEQDEKHIRAVGKPDDHAEYKLDETGEICIRGGCVMLGYYKDPEATAEVLDADGWFHTGDLARVDEDGFYYITGRKKNIIILDNGENVSPEELENLLSKCEAVKECIVREKGKKICAVIYCGEADQQTVRDFITETNRTLPLYKRMSAVEFSTEPLPRTGTGKLLRK